jgi:aminopeptidase N
MKESSPKVIYLKDYQVPAYVVDSIALHFDLGEAFSIVTSSVVYKRNTESQLANTLVLDGEQLELLSVSLDTVLLTEKDYTQTEDSLAIANVPEQFSLEIKTRIYPQKNTSLEGLYQSSGNFCTQCEAQGFRKITYYLDRPDVMARFSTEIIADKAKYPILLSNGNLDSHGDLDNGQHWAKWSDPHRKPAYLFALVVGDLEQVEDQYQTLSGRDVTLKIYTEAHNIDKCDYAMASLKRAMHWDEQRFGLEYDLDIYMIVAVDDFNMGAMENKGLNVFNSKLVFASPETATDDNYIAIEAVIGHEYFHNWTGNRVTCRDWFQLSLKEGLTVFRDQEFTADLHSRAVKRIEDVRMLRSHQFAEDASPLAHPIRPASFAEINNFYTLTVYEKGAEVVRLYHSLLGETGFRKGMDLYFQRHDGQVVTTEDFLAAMSDANGRDLSQFQTWYSQAGTPTVTVTMDYDASQQRCQLNFSQSCPKTAETEQKEAFIIPIKLALLDAQGQEYDLGLDNETLILTEFEQQFSFNNITEFPIPSLLRGFSAPVKLHYSYSTADYIFLMKQDSDEFNRWNAAQQLATSVLLEMLAQYQAGKSYGLSHEVIEAYQDVLNNHDLDAALRAEALLLPSQNELAEACDAADPEAIFIVHEHFIKTLANSLRIDFEMLYAQLNQNQDEYRVEHHDIGQRALKNRCLSYLAYIDDDSSVEQIYQQFAQANNMTDQLAAFNCLRNMDNAQHDQAITAFHDQWHSDSLVMDKWFLAQATSTREDCLERVKALMQHALFDIRNPNKVRSLINAFALANPVRFHAKSGAGYEFIADQVMVLDSLNPQIASRLVRSLMNWRHYETGRAEKMQQQLQRIAAKTDLSKDVAEIVSKSLQI